MPLLHLEPLPGNLAGGAVHPRVGPLVTPGEGLNVQIPKTGELAAVEEAFAHVLDPGLHLAFGFGIVGPAGPRGKSTRQGKVQEVFAPVW